MIDQATGVPSLKRRRAKDRDLGALALEEALKERMPERTLLEGLPVVMEQERTLSRLAELA